MAFASSILPICTPIGSLCSKLSLEGDVQGYHVPPLKHVGLGARFRPVRTVGHVCPTKNDTPPDVAFSLKCINPFTCLSLRSLSRIQLISPYQLSSTHPIMVIRRALVSRFAPRLPIDNLRYIVRAALYSCP